MFKRLTFFVEEISFAVDDRVYATIVPPQDGFASLGSLLGINTNAWKTGSKLAPFDKEVSKNLNYK